MVRPKTPKTRCANCGKTMTDPMQERYTCPYCGCSPVPSRVYPADSGFHPKTLTPRLRQLIEQRRRAAQS